ncbi:hypothetical protein CR513_28148, partial [Mucuna pruriens]
MVNEVDTIDNSRLENQLTELTSLVRQLAIGQHQPIAVVKACGICTLVEHPTDMCPTLQETEPDHPESFKPEHALEPRQLSTAESNIPSSTISTIAATENATTSNLEFQQTMSSSNLQFQQNMSAITQVGQLANSVSQLESTGFENLPSQTIPNPRGNASVVSLRSGRELQAAPQQKPRSTGTESKQDADSQAPQQARPILVSFPSLTLKVRNLESNEELLKMFRKVETTSHSWMP